jgi:hypothetical protein
VLGNAVGNPILVGDPGVSACVLLVLVFYGGEAVVRKVSRPYGWDEDVSGRRRRMMMMRRRRRRTSW